MVLMAPRGQNEKNRAQNAHGLIQTRVARGGGSKPSGTWLANGASVKGIEAEPVMATGGLADKVLTSTEPVQQLAQVLHLPSPSWPTFADSVGLGVASSVWDMDVGAAVLWL